MDGGRVDGGGSGGSGGRVDGGRDGWWEGWMVVVGRWWEWRDGWWEWREWMVGI